MVASPNSSRRFYEYMARDCRLPEAGALTDAREFVPTAPPKPRGFAAGTRPSTHLDAAQHQALLDLLKAHRSAEARRQYIKAGHGTISLPTVTKYAKRRHALGDA